MSDLVESSSVALRFAGELFERERRSGATVEAAMRDAVRVLRVSLDGAAPQPGTARVVPTFAGVMLLRIACHHRTTPEAVRRRNHQRPCVQAREEAAGVLAGLGVPRDDIAATLRCDRYTVDAHVTRFERRMRTDEVLRQRVAVWAAEGRELAAEECRNRRPAQRARVPEVSLGGEA